MVFRILLFPVILFLFLYIAIVLVVPTYQSIGAAEARMENKEKELIEANTKLEEVDTFIQGVKSHPEEEEFAFDFVPDDQREEHIINDVWQIADQSKGESETFNLFSIGFADGGSRSEKKVTGGTSLIEGRVIVSGTYDEFQRFFDQMFRFNRLYTFKTISIAKPDKQEENEDGTTGPQILSGTVTFAYGYVPNASAASSFVFSDPIDYDLISTVKNAVALETPLDSRAEERNNPFLP